MHEYMENGSLQDHLHCNMLCFVLILLMAHHFSNCVLKSILLFAAPNKHLLPWKNRIQIAIDVANALVSFRKTVISIVHRLVLFLFIFVQKSLILIVLDSVVVCYNFINVCQTYINLYHARCRDYIYFYRLVAGVPSYLL